MTIEYSTYDAFNRCGRGEYWETARALWSGEVGTPGCAIVLEHVGGSITRATKYYGRPIVAVELFVVRGAYFSEAELQERLTYIMGRLGADISYGVREDLNAALTLFGMAAHDPRCNRQELMVRAEELMGRRVPPQV